MVRPVGSPQFISQPTRRKTGRGAIDVEARESFRREMATFGLGTAICRISLRVSSRAGNPEFDGAVHHVGDPSRTALSFLRHGDVSRTNPSGRFLLAARPFPQLSSAEA